MYSVKEIAAVLKAEYLGSSENVVDRLIIDSRSTDVTSASLFIALVGERHNGHNYISEMYQRGFRNFMVSDRKAYSGEMTGATFIFVKDTLMAFQHLVAHHRSQFSIPVIGVTGSNGKTIVKEWLYQLMRGDFAVCRSPKSYNSQVGVPLSVWQLNETHSYGIFEAGISKPGEMERLEKIIQPSIGVLTNIRSAHDEGFRDTHEKIAEKIKLFSNCRQLVYCMDNPYVHEQLSRMGAFTWSVKEKKADLFISEAENHFKRTVIRGTYNDVQASIEINFTDEASIENAITCWATLLMLGYRQEVISKRMKELHPVAMRLELKQGINNCSVINDSYNSDLASLSIALDFLNQQHQHPKKILILSDILQTGKSENELYSEVARLLKSKGVDQIIGIGPGIKKYSGEFPMGTFFSSTSEFLDRYKKSLSQQFSNATILLKGAREFGFEQINSLLQQKSHDTILEINLNNLIQNVNYFRSKLKSGTKLMAMVKASSYGSGSYEIASALQFHRVDYLAVAYADEGVELRKAGITLPIMVMSPEIEAFDDIISYHLEPELFSFRVFHRFIEHLKKHSIIDYPVHLKLDTGMHRLGFEKNEMQKLGNELAANIEVKVKSVFSHLSSSDEPSLDEYTKAQISLFEQMSDELLKNVFYPVLKHVCNSGGIARFPEAHFDMVRLGIGMYGVGVNDSEQKHLANVGTLKTTISQIKQVEPGDAVGYNRKGKVSRSARIATVPIGYADGLSRKLSNGHGEMYINGKPAPVIGNVCMDMCMLDVTDIACSEGDQVIIFDSIEKLNKIAQQSETITYEVLTSVSTRVKRIYVQE